jgi:hypothetical protein
VIGEQRTVAVRRFAGTDRVDVVDVEAEVRPDIAKLVRQTLISEGPARVASAANAIPTASDAARAECAPADRHAMRRSVPS